MAGHQNGTDRKARLRELEAEFERGLREKQLLLDELGLTLERIEAFEQRLKPDDRKRYAEVGAEIEQRVAASAAPQQASTRSVRARGVRV